MIQMTRIRGRSRKVRCGDLIEGRFSHSYAPALDQRLSRLPPTHSPSDIVHSSDKLVDLDLDNCNCTNPAPS